MSKCGCHRDCLRPSVERSIANAHVFRPSRNQSPTHGCEVATLLSLFFADCQDWLSRSNVVSRTLFNFIIRSLKALGKVLLRVRQSVSVAHQSIVADSEAVPLAHGTHAGAKLWIITESDRSVAPLLLPDEY